MIVELVSVNPYALVNCVLGNSLNARSISARGILPPPYEIERTLGSSASSSRASMMRVNIVGTTNALVTLLSSRARSIHFCASKFGSWTMRRPE